MSGRRVNIGNSVRPTGSGTTRVPTERSVQPSGGGGAQGSTQPTGAGGSGGNTSGGNGGKK